MQLQQANGSFDGEIKATIAFQYQVNGTVCREQPILLENRRLAPACRRGLIFWQPD
jgi:hypothetical protein